MCDESFLMSHYNYKAYREYRALADFARRTGEPEEVIEDMEYMAAYFWGLLGGNANPDRQRKKRAVDLKDGNREQHYDMGGEWSQLRSEE